MTIYVPLDTVTTQPVIGVTQQHRLLSIPLWSNCDISVFINVNLIQLQLPVFTPSDSLPKQTILVHDLPSKTMFFPQTTFFLMLPQRQNPSSSLSCTMNIQHFTLASSFDLLGSSMCKYATTPRTLRCDKFTSFQTISTLTTSCPWGTKIPWFTRYTTMFKASSQQIQGGTCGGT